MWSPAADLAVFGGSAALAFGVVGVGHLLGIADGVLPEWGWLGFVLAVDVAHVWSTLFRTYLDGQELRRHKLRYVGVPIACYAVGVALHAYEPLMFWRILAYVAVFHFIRQQVGWVAIYRARAEQRGLLDKVVDEGAVYACTLYPVVHWHAHLATTRFAWFVQGDFIDLGAVAAAILPFAKLCWVGALSLFAARQLQLAVRSSTVHVGKLVVVVTTAAIWYVGIVATNSDFTFSVTNVIAHGVPYIALLWAYARERRKEAPELIGSQIAGWGIGGFVGVLLLLAFLEELAWDRMVWHERSWLFGTGPTLGTLAMAFVVPLLSLPQVTHYVLDGVLWRRKDTRQLPAQRAAIGFPVSPSPSS